MFCIMIKNLGAAKLAHLLNIRHDHIVKLLSPVGVEVCHLEPVGFILDAYVIQLNEHLLLIHKDSFLKTTRMISANTQRA